MKKTVLVGISFSVALAGWSPQARALGECGLSCCIGSAAASPVTLASTVGVGLQYEHSHMETIRSGTTVLSPDEVIDRTWSSGGSVSVPLDMTMRKITLTAAAPVTERLVVMGIFPYVINDMNMRMKNAMGMVMDHEMETISGVGDFTLMGLYTLYTDAPVRPSERLTVGAGLKLPTGKNDFRSSSGKLVHAMMQPGTGSWDPVFTASYMRAWYPLVLQANVFAHVSTTGDEGYRFGSQFNYEIASLYQVHEFVNVGFAFNGVIAGRDTDSEGAYTKAGSMSDNVGNTGVHTVFASPSIQGKIPGTSGAFEVKYQFPLYQRLNGYQQGVDSRFLGSVSWNF